MTYAISLPYEPINTRLNVERINWARMNCSSYQHNYVNLPYKKGFTTIDFVFDDEKDAIMFALRWS